MVGHTHRVLAQAFAQAVEDGLIPRSPCEGLSRALPKVTRRERIVLTPEDAVRFLGETRDTPLGALWCTLLNTGLRPQEALALKWSDITPDGALTVQRALVRVAENGRVEVRHDMKSPSARRRLGLDPQTLGALGRHRKEQAAAILKTGARYHKDDYIFANSIGRPLAVARVGTAWRAALAKAGLPPMRLYDTRHTHATHLLQVTDPKTAAARLGHANPAILLTVYAHVLPQAEQNAVNALAILCGRGSSPKCTPTDGRAVR